MTLLELAERCEAATGPDEELDVAIVYGLYPDIGPYQGQCIGDPPIFWHDPYRKRPCPKFTASIDAALTLVPEGAAYRIYHWPKQTEGARACMLFEGGREAWADTPALAICAAALRARATGSD